MAEAALRQVSCAKCELCAIHNRAICRAATGDALERLNAISSLKSYRKDETVIHQGEDAHLVGNVVSGILRLTKATPDGKSQIVGLLYPSDFFGRIFKNHSEFAIEAATDVTLCCMDRGQFEDVIDRYPALEHELLVTVLEELDATRESLAMFSCKETMERVASFLLLMLKRAPSQRCEQGAVPILPIVSVPIARRDLAGLLGTTVETISRHIQSLSRRKIIRIIDPRHFVVLDSDRLMEIAGEFDNNLAGALVARPAGVR